MKTLVQIIKNDVVIEEKLFNGEYDAREYGKKCINRLSYGIYCILTADWTFRDCKTTNFLTEEQKAIRENKKIRVYTNYFAPSQNFSVQLKIVRV